MENWLLALLAMGVGSYIIAKASNIFEVATDYLGRNMKDGVKGVTLNAIGSSFPELLTTVFFLVFATKDNLARDLAAGVGGNTGSAIFNSIIIPMLVIHVVIAAGASKFNVSKKVILRDGIFLIAAELLLLVILSTDTITQWHGWILTIFYLAYLAFTFFTMDKGEEPDQNTVLDHKSNWYVDWLLKDEKGRVLRSWALLLLAITIIGFACIALVEGCKVVAEAMDINPLFVALVLVAAASSVPDTIISMKDARKGNHNDALSNVLGSNIFDITISLGLPLAIFLMITGQEINFSHQGDALIDIRVMLLLITMITVLVYLTSDKISRVHVYVFGALYVLFVLYTIGAAQYNAGDETWLARIAGSFIEYLRAPDGLGTLLKKLANSFGKAA